MNPAVPRSPSRVEHKLSYTGDLPVKVLPDVPTNVALAAQQVAGLASAGLRLRSGWGPG